jgi:hypothetical protein
MVTAVGRDLAPRMVVVRQLALVAAFLECFAIARRLSHLSFQAEVAEPPQVLTHPQSRIPDLLAVVVVEMWLLPPAGIGLEDLEP